MKLDAFMREVLIQLEMIASAQGVGVQAFHTGGKPDSREPPRADSSHKRYWVAYRRCKTDRERKSVIRAALIELREMRLSRKPKLDLQTQEGRLTLGRSKQPAKNLAYQYGYTIRHIHRLRQQARAVDANSASDTVTLTSVPWRTVP